MEREGEGVFIVFVLCSEGRGRLRVMSIKTSLSMMSTGKFIDKLKCKLSRFWLMSIDAGRSLFVCCPFAVLFDMEGGWSYQPEIQVPNAEASDQSQCTLPRR